MAAIWTKDLHLVYLDHRPFASCVDRHEAVMLQQALLRTHHSRRVHLLRG
ncbi:hypothetical protein CPCC7001_2535 [Cyanobium sp. PCC 7001]|jgi:hypothetical protein|nr:hypothetical protein [Cyanobium sp. PCC 7001]EDY39654.1 hypothetical protein CPCC7001_2535 [Cyanobium sp. PCC 7001]